MCVGARKPDSEHAKCVVISAFFANPECLRKGFEYHNGECVRTVPQLKNDIDKCRYTTFHDFLRTYCDFPTMLSKCNSRRKTMDEPYFVVMHVR